MSEFLDDLARTLGTPMPRRRALRTLAGAVAAVALPGAIRPQPARAGVRRAIPAGRPMVRPSRTVGVCERTCTGPFPVPCLCKGPTHGCFETCGLPGSTCCCIKGEDGNNAAVVACPPGTRCGRRGESNCPCVNTCGTGCCGAGQFCANRARNLCCKDGQRACGLGCCDANEECRVARGITGSIGVCEKRCPPRQAWCGRNKCCPPRWHCRNERTGLCTRCGPNEEQCGSKCCNRQTSRCCGENVCCQKGRACCTVDNQRICCPPGTKCALQLLPSEGGLTRGSPRVCCPTGRYSRDPELCCPPGQVPLNSPGFAIPPPGVNNGFCCPPSRICRSSQTGNPICVDFATNASHCGRCGNACPSGICRAGVCATA